MKKIKILRIIARLNIGGPARHVIILQEGLANERFDSILVHGSIEKGEGDMSYLIGNNRDKVIFIPEFVRKINPIKDLKAFIKIFSIIRREKPYIVHTHTAKAGTLGRLAAIMTGVPVKIHTFHGHIFYGYFNKISTGIFLMIERFLALFTDRIIAVSEKQKEELTKIYKIAPKKKFNVINLGFSMDQFLSSDKKRGFFRKKYGFKEDNILIGAVGRLVGIKNHRLFLRSIEQLKKIIHRDIYSKVKFLVIGDGPEKINLINYARYIGIANDVIFLGWIQNMDEVYADLDIVALTSKNEGTPLSLIEAFASSKPVIAVSVGGVKDVVSDIGILVDDDEENAFAQGLKELIQSYEKRKEIGLKGREWVMQKFSKENLVQSIEKLYHELLKEKGVSV